MNAPLYVMNWSLCVMKRCLSVMKGEGAANGGESVVFNLAVTEVLRNLTSTMLLLDIVLKK